MNIETIDFILAWVDGGDPIYRAAKSEYAGSIEFEDREANGECRYRSEPDMLRYWFRSVEKYAPWVRKIHFVTCGQKPDWLEVSHPKLDLVNHCDYIPDQYLPTFNARTIELNYHRIADLSEHYVLFNDDIFLLQPITPDFFFKDGNPVLVTDLRYPKYLSCQNWCRVLFNDYCVINKQFNMRKSIWKYRRKWFNLKELGFKRTRQNITSFFANKSLPVGNYAHLALPHLKSTLKEIWDCQGEIMDATCKHKFRSDDQVNQWLCCGWNQAEGRFYPAHEKNLGIRVVMSPRSVGRAEELILGQSVPQICTNDTSLNTDYYTSCERVLKALSTILPTRSSFEKY